ncbi:response regulator transcription factor [Paenibacillus mendelii]|uniref:Response regulator n=1 Tax=Paenibacillus mendelii TaxID=206163 RepID=A0ABV6JJN2_9BACL|nr:response regulator [Paenibacillus mendelii]MCQ6559063.1 response regulator [Paenibacillus mendelii]
MYKVLIVDDEMIVRHAVKTLIRWEGSRFEYAGAAASGVSALDMARNVGADIIITDIKMPEMDGLELIKQLMSGGFDGEVLVLSNYNDFDLVREALKCGAHDYLLKLTLKTESFMRVLEEMAAKLDAKQEKRGVQPEISANRPEAKDDIPAMLREMDSAHPAAPLRHAAGKNEDLIAAAGLRVYSFVVLLTADEQGLRQSGSFQETLDKLADSLFSGSRWTYAIRSDQLRFLLVTAYLANQAFADPDDLARRMISLASMYYNVQISVVYAAAAANMEELAAEMNLSRQAEGLFFYAQPRVGCLSNRLMTIEGDEKFRLAEAKLVDSLRKPSAGSIDIWAESALRLIETAAERNVHPRMLKRAISGGVWSLANTEELGVRYGWDEKPWLERIEAANGDSALKETIRELAEEVADSARRLPDLPVARGEVRQAQLYLEENYSNRITIADIASHVGLSEPYLCQVFKAETGVSILTSLNEIRMVKAHEMLASGKYLVKQVAIEVGIPDPFYFNRLFKKRYGIAPKNVKMT